MHIYPFSCCNAVLWNKQRIRHLRRKHNQDAIFSEKTCWKCTFHVLKCWLWGKLTRFWNRVNICHRTGKTMSVTCTMFVSLHQMSRWFLPSKTSTWCKKQSFWITCTIQMCKCKLFIFAFKTKQTAWNEVEQNARGSRCTFPKCYYLNGHATLKAQHSCSQWWQIETMERPNTLIAFTGKLINKYFRGNWNKFSSLIINALK